MNTDIRKITQVLSYIAQKEWNQINYTKALKLVFFSDKLFLRKYWRLITGDSYVALKNGPVASTTCDIIKMPEEFDSEYIESFLSRNSYDILLKKNPDMDYLAEKEIQVIDEVYKEFWKYSQWELIDLTHDYQEWDKHKSIASSWGAASMDVRDFFSNSLNQNDIFTMTEDNLDLSKDIYQESLSYAW